MPLFLVTSLIDEGMYDNDFQLVEADSKLAVAQHILLHPHQWENYLRHAYPRDWQDRTFDMGSLWDCVNIPGMTAERFLKLINMTSVDGDSASQLRIFEAKVQQLSQVDTNPFYV
ncbi:hypothetical protein FACHB389_34430 [Nostoc calcicola FACHB-389]|nr:hypothetical protein [Nostoc calcicola FACHB-3891]OKH17712.1 hypothetical protein FACHB389_34430 [Nostoc calcicola FACHB-389]